MISRLVISSFGLVMTAATVWAEPALTQCRASHATPQSLLLPQRLHPSANLPEHRYNTYFQVSCNVPNVSSTDMLRVAQRFANGERGGENAIPWVYRPFGIQPRVKAIADLRHTSDATIATVNMFADATPEAIATHCTRVNQAGVIAKGKNMDLEYKCRVHIKSGEGKAMAQTVARLLMTSTSNGTSLQQQARDARVKLCLLATTDIQCAPCKTSDKLVARFQSVAKTSRVLPAGALHCVE